MNSEAITEIKCHDDLLNAWKEKISSSKCPFDRDGIISPEDWEKSEVKVLVVLKETNHPKDARDKSTNVVEEIRKALNNPDSGWWRKNVLRRVGRWAFGLTAYSGEVPSFEKARSCGKNSIRSIAYMNMKKSPGGAKTNKMKFDAHVQEYAPYIRRQIELIKPDIVVLGGTFYPVRDHVFPELERVCERIHRFNGIVFINAFHPAQRKISANKLYHQVLDSYNKYKTSYASKCGD